MIQVKAEIDEQVLEQRKKALAALSVKRPVIRKYIQDFVRKELREIRKNVVRDARSNMKEDPRNARQGVKTSIYRRILGGNISILNPKKASPRYKLIKERKLDQNPNQRGGNRRKRSERTEQVDSYNGRQRAFILRFQNSGTKPRMTRYGNRGMIQGRRWFELSALFHTAEGAEQIAKMIEEILAEEFDKEKA